jgi:hypothetical protein
MSKLNQPMRQVSDRASEHLSKERDRLISHLAGGYSESMSDALHKVQATIDLLDRLRGD